VRLVLRLLVLLPLLLLLLVLRLLLVLLLKLTPLALKLAALPQSHRSVRRLQHLGGNHSLQDPCCGSLEADPSC